ncbi:glycine-rich domain-containing protein [Anaerovorax odorimutans]|uniref:glycine-rich domain-containing protein n=1 Tax=Anaerovorax odorimutans TaxID=109327 RepID=UPI0003F5AF66|nr:hypothetical protein [Anaerovorax odorimutans]
MAYSNYIQFVTSDGLEFATSDDENFYTKTGIYSSDDYFTDTENGQESLNTLTFGTYTFSGSQIKTLQLHFETGLLTDQLAIDTLTAEIKSNTKPTITRYTPITVYRNGEVMGVFFNGTIKEAGINLYSIYAESYITLLDYDYHFGGMYTGQTTGDIISSIMGDIPYTINEGVAAIKMYGYLPYATKRENLQQVLIATGAAIERNTDGTINFTVLDSTNKGTFGAERTFESGKTTEDTQITAVQVTEHAYTPITEEITLLKESFTDIRTTIFQEPAHNLVCTNGTILASGVNYAKIQGSGNVTLTGQKYQHVTKIVTKGTVTDTPEDKTYTVTNATLITAMNSSFVAKRLYYYARCNKTVSQDVLIEQERTGNMVQTIHPYSTEYLSAAIQSLDFNLSNTMRAATEFLVDYVPLGITEGYKNRVVVTASGNWTVPNGVIEIRAVLIGGGSGGIAGANGGSGSRGTNTSSPGIGASGSGGKGGVGGSGGKIFDTTIEVTPGQTIAAVIGAGGAAGQNGTATTFGAATSNSGAAGEYIDTMTAERYATTGDSGIDGKKGNNQEYLVYDGEVYWSGKNGYDNSMRVNGTKIVGFGGGGGGPAAGSNGGRGLDGSVEYNSGDGYASGGNGARGANAINGKNATVYGGGGNGGNGGGGGGGGGDCYHPESQYAWPGSGGSGGSGSSGGSGAQGCVIIYY